MLNTQKFVFVMDIDWFYSPGVYTGCPPVFNELLSFAKGLVADGAGIANTGIFEVAWPGFGWDVTGALPLASSVSLKSS